MVLGAMLKMMVRGPLIFKTMVQNVLNKTKAQFTKVSGTVALRPLENGLVDETGTKKGETFILSYHTDEGRGFVVAHIEP